jgi:pilus assembly protein CpaB
MRAVFGLVLLVGVMLAGAAVYMAQGYIGQTQRALAAERELRAKTGPLVEVFVLNKPKNYGDPLTKEDVATIWWQENALPEGIFRLADEAVLFPEGEDAPRFIRRTMLANEPVLAARVTEPGEVAGLTGKLERGMRAFAIKVDVASGVSGFLQPDDLVDVYWTGVSQGAQGEITRLIEATVKIIAVDQMSAADAVNGATVARTVTVAATPEEVARLAQAQATGRLALSLVGKDDEEAGTIEVTANDITGTEIAAPVAEVQERVCTVRTNKGGEITEIPVPCPTN